MDLGNVDDPLAETIHILLSDQTHESVYRRLFVQLRRRYPQWLDVLAAPEEESVVLLEPGGLFRQRAQKLEAAVETRGRERGIGPAADPPGDLTLDFLRVMSDAQAESFLLALPGVGPKTARCVLSYSLARATFAVDTHVHRIFPVRRQSRGLCMGAPLGPLTPGFNRVPTCRGGGPAVTVRNSEKGAPHAAASLRRRVS